MRGGGIQPLSCYIFFCVIDQRFDCIVKRAELVRQSVCNRLHQGELFGKLVNVHYIHRGGAVRAENRREWEDYSFGNICAEAFHVRSACSSGGKQDELLRAVATQMNFLHDG